MRGPGRRWGRTLAFGGGAVLLSFSVQAQWGASVAIDSDYRFRGVSLSDSKPGLRLTLNHDGPGAWYAGVSATRAALTASDRYTQVLGYGGWLAPLDAGHSLELGASVAHFAGNSAYDYAEPYVGLLADRWQLRLYFSPNYFGRHVQTVYAEWNLQAPLNERVRLFSHLGVLVTPRDNGDEASRTRGDVRLGAGLVHRDSELQLAWVAATRGGPYPAQYQGRRSTLVLSAAHSF